MNAGAVIVMQQRRAVERFLERGCTTPEAALSLEELGVSPKYAIKRLIHSRVLREASPGSYWLDRAAWEEFEARRRVLTLGLLGVGVVVTAFVLYFNS